MKKNLLLTILSFAVIGLSFAQLPFSENFTAGIPLSWQNIDNSGVGGGVWSWETQGGNGFVVFDSDGAGNDGLAENADLITPTINCTGSSFVALSFLSNFTQYANSVGTVSVSNDGGATWNSVYTVSASGGEVALIDITAFAANQANVKLKFNYVGNWDYFWVVDDVRVYAPATKDFAALSINNGLYNDISNAPFFINGTLVNLGSETITTFDINYEIDGGTPVTATITGVNIGFGDEYNFSHATGWTPSASGDFVVTAYASNLNGGADVVPGNNEVDKTLTVYDVAVQRVPLFEVFTSSTCPPCKPGNEKLHSVIDTKPDHAFADVKYQQFGPGTGDPYCTDETQRRYGHHYPSALNGGYSIPAMWIDGGWGQNANSFSETVYTDAVNKPSFTFLHATYTVDAVTKTVTVNVEGLPITDFPASNYRVEIAVIENRTTMNVKNNGETQFLEVAKKLLPNDVGTTVASLNSLTPFTASETFTFQGSYRLPANGQAANRINHATEHSVEEFSDLRVVVWVEDVTSKEVLQAFNAVDPLDSDGDGTPDAVEAYSGTSPTNANDFPDLDNDGLSDWKEVTDGTNPLVEDANAIQDVKFNMAVVVSPVPANANLNVEFTLENAEDVSLTIVAVDGKVMSSKSFANTSVVNASFDVSALANGVYFMQIETKNGLTTEKFMVNHK